MLRRDLKAAKVNPRPRVRASYGLSSQTKPDQSANEPGKSSPVYTRELTDNPRQGTQLGH
jgi:hypothetical protein